VCLQPNEENGQCCSPVERGLARNSLTARSLTWAAEREPCWWSRAASLRTPRVQDAALALLRRAAPVSTRQSLESRGSEGGSNVLSSYSCTPPCSTWQPAQAGFTQQYPTSRGLRELQIDLQARAGVQLTYTGTAPSEAMPPTKVLMLRSSQPFFNILPSVTHNYSHHGPTWRPRYHERSLSGTSGP